MYNQNRRGGLFRIIGQKALISTLFILLATSSLFAGKEYVLKITLDDGSFKEYAVSTIKKISFSADPNDEMDEVQKKYNIADEDMDDSLFYGNVYKKVAPNVNVAMENASQNSIKIIPTKNSVLVSSLNETPAKVFVFNLQGMCLKKFATYLHSGLNQFELDKGTFKNSQYILRVKTPTNEISAQFSVAD